MFLGQRIVRRPKGHKRYVYTFVANEAPASIRRKLKALTGRSTTNMELSELVAALNPVLRGWANYYRHAAAKRTLEYLAYHAWWRAGRWLRKKHPRLTWKQINRRYINEDHTFEEHGLALYNPASISVTRYRFRGARIPNPWTIEPTANPSGVRVQRASREEQRSLARVQQALASHDPPDVLTESRMR